MAKTDTRNTDAENPRDFYVEPDWVWPAIFAHEAIVGTLLDPCCVTETYWLRKDKTLV